VKTVTLPVTQSDRDLSPALSTMMEQALLDQQNVMVSRSLLMVGLAVDQLVNDQLAAEANQMAICMVGELNVTFFLLTTVHVTDYHWDRHHYFVIHSHHAQTMTHTPPSDDSILILLLVVLAACDSD
jgi:hypothetical protein